jgi:hypothetical protein
MGGVMTLTIDANLCWIGWTPRGERGLYDWRTETEQFADHMMDWEIIRTNVHDPLKLTSDTIFNMFTEWKARNPSPGQAYQLPREVTR